MSSTNKHITPGASKESGSQPGGAKSTISVCDVSGSPKPKRCNFPGPRGALATLRVAIDRAAHVELIAHAKESFNAEICGVLAGNVCEDDEGVFVHIRVAIRGSGADQGSTHVTFTHATWTAIHQKLERDFPDLQIVGWYHSHPGFGVEFSEMDLFIQRNFFSSPTQIALVTDPLSGAMAICFNSAEGIEYLPRFWVDGREQEGKIPARHRAGKAAASGATVVGVDERRHSDIEARLVQLVTAVDDLRTALHRFLLFAGALVSMAIIMVAGYGVYLQLKQRVQPPANIGFAPVPVRIGEHNALLGVGVVSWQLPPELDPVELALKDLKKQMEVQAESSTNAGASNTNSSERPRTR